MEQDAAAAAVLIELELLLALAWSRWQLRQAEVAVGGPSAVARTKAKTEGKWSNIFSAHACIQ